MVRRTQPFLPLASALIPLVACAAPEEGAARAAPQRDLEEAPTEVDSLDAPVFRWEEGWNVATGENEHITLGWRARRGAVPRNEEFEIEVQLLEHGVPRGDARLHLRGWMPDHGHGFIRQPLVTDLGEGRYRLENVLLHMRGSWQLFFHVEGDGLRDVFEFEVEL